MKRSLRMKIMLLLFALVVGISSAWAQKITRKANIVSNTSYYIGATTGSPATDYYLQLPASSGDKGTAVTSTSSATVFVFEAVQGKTDVYKIKIANTSNYLYTLGTGSSNNGKLTFGTTAAEFTVSNQGSEGNYKIRLSNNSRSIQKNNSGTQFGSYGDTQTDIWLLPASSYTITVAVNNGSMGSASVLGTTITAAPNDGYRVISGAGGYTVTAGTATVVNNGNNTFTVTPSSDCTVRVNFEAIPTHTLSSTISPIVVPAAGTVTLGATTIREGATTTASADASAGYKFKNWSITGTGASLSSTSTNPTTVTMGTADATVTATFEAVTTHAITYSVNGVTNTVNVEEDAAIDLSAPASALIPVGYVFKGWRTSTLPAQDTDPNDYVTSAKSTANITYYAVVAAESFNNATWTLDYDNESDLSSSTSWGSYGTSYNYTASDGGTWTIKAYKNSGMQINTGKDCSIKVPSCSGSIKSIAITCSAAKAVGFSDSNYSGSGTITYVVSGTDATSQTLDFTGKSKTNGYIVPKSGSTSITKIVVTYKNPTYSGYCTTVSSVSITEDVTIAGDLNVTYTLTVPTDKTLTVNGTLTNTTAANLIIEDGGQLICNSSVPATFKKTMTAPSKDVYGWELISSPVHDGTGSTIAVANVTNLVSNADPSFKYDMFAYDEEYHMWRTQKKEGGATGFTTLNNGEGYMYRNSGNELSFVGNTNSDAVAVVRVLTYTTGDLAGFHLVGNPYTHSITVKDNVSLLGDGDVALESGKQLSGYYLLTNGGSEWTSKLGTTTDIATKQGFLIQIPAEAKKIKFSNGAKKDRANADNIMFTVANSQFNDVAYALFDNAFGLNKINHRNADAPMLFINQNGQDFAIAAMSDDTKSFNLNFKAGTISQYTLSYKADGKFEYLHVIDRLTGEDVDMLLEGEYSFIGHPKDNENRFIVRLAYASDNNDSSNDIFAYQSGSEIYVTGNGELQIFDVTGRRVMTTTINDSESISIPNQGVYIFRLNEKVQKIVVR